MINFGPTNAFTSLPFDASLQFTDKNKNENWVVTLSDSKMELRKSVNYDFGGILIYASKIP